MSCTVSCFFCGVKSLTSPLTNATPVWHDISASQPRSFSVQPPTVEEIRLINTMTSVDCVKYLQTRRLIEANEEELVNDSIAQYSSGRLAAQSPLSSQRNSDRANSSNVQADVSWKWSGTDFIKSPTVEPWVIDNSLHTSSIEMDYVIRCSLICSFVR